MNHTEERTEPKGSAWSGVDRRAARPERRKSAVDRRAIERQDLPPLDIDRLYQLAPAFEVLPYAEAQARCCMAAFDEGALLLVADRAAAPTLMPWADAYLRRPFTLRFAPAGDIAAVLAHHGETMRAMDALPAYAVEQQAAGEGVEVLRLDTIQMEESPIVRLTNSTLYDAYKAKVSDIHLEATADGLRIKYRLDGVLSTIAEPKGSQTAEQVISRIKVMAELDIAERRIPQDGRFKVAIDGREVDFRVSIMPSIHGEDAVLRILDKQALTDQMASLTLESLDFEGEFMRTVRRLAREPYGCCWSPARRAAARPRRSTPSSARSTPGTTRSSPSKTRSSTSCPACCRFPSTRRRASPSPAGCARSCATIRTRSWSARSATPRRRRSPCSRR